MKHRKRSMQIMVVFALMAALFLQACSGSGNNTPAPTQSSGSTPTSTTTPEPSKEPEPLEPYEVTIVYRGTPERDDALVEAKLSEYFTEKINATVKLVPITGSEYKQRTELMMNGGEKMDLIFTASWLDFFSNVTKRAFLELDDLLEDHGQGIIESLNPLYLEAPRFQDKLYAIPTNKEITQAKAFTYRKDIVEKYNIPIETINTNAELEPYMKLIKENEPDIIPNFVAGGSGGGDGIMYETNGNYRPIGPTPGGTALFFYDYTKDNNIEIINSLHPDIVSINQKEYGLSRGFFEKGYTNADAATNTTNISDLRKQGKIWLQRAVWKPGADIELDISTENQYSFISHVLDEPIVTTDLATGSMFSISRTSKDPARAMMVLNYLHTDPYAVNLIVNGIEDVHYDKVGDNRIEPIADSGYGTSGLFWVIGNQMINYLKPGQPDDLYENWIQFNNDAKRSPIHGFVFDDTNVKNEITQLVSIATEYRAISTGAIANYAALHEERNKKFEAAGIEKVRAEIQEQVTAWEATK